MRFVSYTCASRIAAAVLALAALPPHAARGAASGRASGSAWNEEAARALRPPPGVRVLSVTPDADPAGTIDRLEAEGFHVDVAVAPGIYYVRGAGGAALPVGVTELSPAAVPARAATAPAAELPPIAGVSVGFGDEVLEPAAPARFSRPAAGIAAAPETGGGGLFHGTRWGDTSELMYGRVALPILFPESDGTVDTNRYDWTPALKDSVIRSAIRGCLQWTSLAATAGVPLTFALEIHADLPTRYEPITRPAGQVDLWMAEAMQPLLGYKGDADAMAYEIANAARARLGAQWAALCFAIQNDTSSVSGFPDGTSERARLGGPWFMVAVRHANANVSTLDSYMEHEMAHMFWALDEYPANNAWWSCTLLTGYFNQQNSNSDIPAPGYCGPRDNCVMRGNWPESVCDPTRRQIGWTDVNFNALLDLHETRPGVEPDSSQYHSTAGQPVTIRGTASEGAWPNLNPYRFGAGDSISTATTDSLAYRIDAGPWIQVAAQDGRFDSGEERFVAVLPPPAPGNHLVEWQAWNSNGQSLGIPVSTIVTVAGASASVEGSGGAVESAPRLDAGPTPSAGPVRFALRAGSPAARSGADAAVAVARLYDVAGRVVRSWRLAVPAGGIAEWDWDARLEDGTAAPGGVYFLAVEIGAERLKRRIVLLR